MNIKFLLAQGIPGEIPQQVEAVILLASLAAVRYRKVAAPASFVLATIEQTESPERWNDSPAPRFRLLTCNDATDVYYGIKEP